MLKKIRKKSFIALVFKDKPKERQIYFVNEIKKERFGGGMKLFGHLVSVMERHPAFTLRMNPKSSGEVYFPIDWRVMNYDNLTKEEKEDTRTRLTALAKEYPKAAELITFL